MDDTQAVEQILKANGTGGHEALMDEEPVTAGKIMDTMKFIGQKITEVSIWPWLGCLSCLWFFLFNVVILIITNYN